MTDEISEGDDVGVRYLLVSGPRAGHRHYVQGTVEHVARDGRIVVEWGYKTDYRIIIDGTDVYDDDGSALGEDVEISALDD